MLYYAYSVNVVLGVFNLFPIPPLDGSRIVGAFMDDATYRAWSALDQYGMLFIFGLLFVFRGSSPSCSTRPTTHAEVMVRVVGG